MLKFKASDLVTVIPSSVPPSELSQYLGNTFEWMSEESVSSCALLLDALLYLYDTSVYIESRSTSIVFVVPEDFDFSVLRGIPFFYDRRTDAEGHFFLHFHVSIIFSLLFYEKYSCYKAR